MNETLYRKYRPKNFSEIIGQSHIVRTLTNAIINKHVGQAYLFTGPRGTGKTSIARILAKTVNCENLKDAISCEKCEPCRLISENKILDIIEIDAASNTGVDNIRELRETVALPPAKLKYKAYIIDEVHMLSMGAFNALLKTLEEPPAHVIFILATTEIHKVPETIISRCQRFDFSRLPIQNIIEKLSLIAKKEKIKIDKPSLEMIAIAAEGGMRDAESLFSQIIALEDKEITVSEVEEILGTADRKFTEDVAGMIVAKDTAGAIGKINSLLDDGYDLSVFAKSLINYFRQLMLLKVSENLSSFFAYEMTGDQIEGMKKMAQKAELANIISTINLLLEAQGKISSFILPQLPLEIAIIKATNTLPQLTDINQEMSNANSKLKIQNSKLQLKIQNDNSSLNPPLHPGEDVRGTGERQLPERDKVSRVTKDTLENDMILDIDLAKDSWNRLLNEIKPYNHSLNALLSNCQIVSVEKNTVTIATPYDFYRERLDDPANRLTIEKVFSSILGLKISISIVTDKAIEIENSSKERNKEPEKSGTQDPLLASALEIMGGKIVE
jgi:DNA polymerase III subunit gamma/tau